MEMVDDGKLFKVGIKPFLENKREGYDGQVNALCPFHNDHNPSFSVNSKSGLWICHAGCGEGNAVQFYAKLKGITEKESYRELSKKIGSNGNSRQIVAIYDYHDEKGKLLYEMVRYSSKDFLPRRPDGQGGWVWNLKDTRRVLYNLPQLLEAAEVYIVEGEKDADTLREIGLIATTNPFGAGKWRPEYNEWLREKRVVILPDADERGREHARQVGESLVGIAASVKIIELPGLAEKQDISDWLDAGHRKEELLDKVQNAAEFDSSAYIERLTDEKGKYRFRSPTQILSSAPEPIWIWNGLIAEGMLMFLAGRAKCGKSTLMFALIRALLTGTDFLGMECKRSSAVLLTEENDASVGEKLKRFQLEEETKNLSILTRNGVAGRPILADVIHQAGAEAHKIGAKLVIVDTLAFWAGIRGEGENHAGTMSEVLYPVLELTAQGFGVVLLHHTRKRGNDLRGSSIIEASADIIVTLHREPEKTNRRRLEAVGRFRETPDALLVELGDADYTTLGTPQNVTQNERRNLILEVLSENGKEPMSQMDLATTTALSKQRVSEALSTLIAEGKVRRLGTGRKGDRYMYQKFDSSVMPLYGTDETENDLGNVFTT